MLIIAAVFSVSAKFVTKDVFIEFKEGTIEALSKKVDQMDKKLDRLLERQYEQSSGDKQNNLQVSSVQNAAGRED